MLVLARLAVVAVLCLSLFGSAVAQTATYTFCYQLLGLASSTLDDPYAISVLVTGSYNTTLLSSTATKYTPVGEYYNLLTATGTRTINTRNNSTRMYAITGLALNADFADNRFYISNATFPQFVDGNGLTFNVTANAEFPGKQFGSIYNLYRTGVYGPVLESLTSGINLKFFNLTASIDNWTGQKYSGKCKPPAFNPVLLPSKIQSGNTSVAISYNLKNTTGETTWTVAVKATLYSDGTWYGPDDLGDKYIVLNSAKRLPVNGTRTYCYFGTCSTSRIYAVAPLNLYTFSDNRIYGYSPYLTYNGIGYLIDPAQPKPGFDFNNLELNYTSSVNPYVSKAGQFFEGFGNGGTGPNGRVFLPTPYVLPLSATFTELSPPPK